MFMSGLLQATRGNECYQHVSQHYKIWPGRANEQALRAPLGHEHNSGVCAAKAVEWMTALKTVCIAGQGRHAVCRRLGMNCSAQSG